MSPTVGPQRVAVAVAVAVQRHATQIDFEAPNESAISLEVVAELYASEGIPAAFPPLVNGSGAVGPGGPCGIGTVLAAAISARPNAPAHAVVVKQVVLIADGFPGCADVATEIEPSPGRWWNVDWSFLHSA